MSEWAETSTPRERQDVWAHICRECISKVLRGPDRRRWLRATRLAWRFMLMEDPPAHWPWGEHPLFPSSEDTP